MLHHLPHEIGHLTKLKTLDVYTSYIIHYLPYEVTRCSGGKFYLKHSIRAFYLSSTSGQPLPALPPFPSAVLSLRELAARVVVELELPTGSLPSDLLEYIKKPQRCSVCDRIYCNTKFKSWSSLWTAFPLLAVTCSLKCANAVPPANTNISPRDGRFWNIFPTTMWSWKTNEEMPLKDIEKNRTFD